MEEREGKLNGNHPNFNVLNYDSVLDCSLRDGNIFLKFNYYYSCFSFTLDCLRSIRIRKEKKELIAIDVETGGLDPQNHALLSVCLIKLDEDLNCVDMDYTLVNSYPYFVEEEALLINRIKIKEHNEIALSREDAAAKIIRLLAHWREESEKLSFLGHNVNFDISFLKRLFTPDTWNFYVGYRHIDTISVLLALRESGIYSGNLKLEDAMRYYNVKELGVFHDARTDCLGVAYLYKNIVRELKDMNDTLGRECKNGNI